MQKTTRLGQRALSGAVVCAVLLLLRPAHAGLVFEISNAISARSIRHVRTSPQGLVFDIGGQPRTIALTPALQRQVVAWAEQYKGGVMVVSIDGSLIPGRGVYFPPSAPTALRPLLRSWDVFAHTVACGGIPEQEPRRHPLYAQDNNDQRFPAAQHRRLLETGNLNLAAYSYRRLAARYPKPPGCIGELTLYVTPGDGPWPIRLSVSSWIHPQTKLWYRDTDAPSPSDQVAARIPYRELKRDMEERWDVYRHAFAALDQLSATIEAMTLLQALRKQRPDLWTEFRQQMPDPPERPRPAPDPFMIMPEFVWEPWHRIALGWIGEHIDTGAKANLALGLLAVDVTDSLPWQRWIEEIEAVSQHDRRLRGKLELFATYVTPTAKVCQEPEQLESLLLLLREGSHDAFRLRARALSLLEDKLQDCDKAARPGAASGSPSAEEGGPQSLDAASIRHSMDEASERLVHDFLAMARPRCIATPGAPDDLGPWEDLTQDVYSVGLLARASTTAMFQDVLEAVACIHHRRALAPQTGRELGYRHAHLRLLMLLKDSARSTELRARIDRYVGEIATSLHLAEW